MRALHRLASTSIDASVSENGGEKMETSVAEEIRRFVIGNYLFGDESRMPDDDESLIENGVVDSTGILELIEFLEETFAITVAEFETVPQNLGSITGVVTYVGAKLTDTRSPATVGP